jgi:response regulator RpfG family c-di-GMP phosphodiesterase
MEGPLTCEQTLSLLLVEDDPSQLRGLSSLMEGEGYNIIGCSAASEAIEHLEHLKAGVVVLDPHRPDLSGTPLLPWPSRRRSRCAVEMCVESILSRFRARRSSSIREDEGMWMPTPCVPWLIAHMASMSLHPTCFVTASWTSG